MISNNSNILEDINNPFLDFYYNEIFPYSFKSYDFEPNPINFIDPFGLCSESSGSDGGINWEGVTTGLQGMGEATVQFLLGLGSTQLDSAAPGPMDIFGVGVMLEAIGDAGLNYGILVAAIMGEDTSDMPTDTVNSTVEAVTDDVGAADTAEAIFDNLSGQLEN